MTPFTPVQPISPIVPAPVHNQPAEVPAPPQPIPNQYVPSYQLLVTVLIPGYPIPQPYSYFACLTEASAAELAALLADPDMFIFDANPANPYYVGGCFGTADLLGVPYFGWKSDGSMINAGALAQFWSHGQPQAYCLYQAKRSISMNHQQWAAYQAFENQ